MEKSNPQPRCAAPARSPDDTAAGPKTVRTTFKGLNRAALLTEIRIESPAHGAGGVGAWNGAHAEGDADEFLRVLRQDWKGPWLWRLQVEYELEDGTAGSTQAVWPHERGTPTVRGLLVHALVYEYALNRTTRAAGAELLRAAGLLLGKPIEKPFALDAPPECRAAIQEADQDDRRWRRP